MPRNSPLFSLLSLSLSLSRRRKLVGRGWPRGKGAAGLESEYSTQERHAQVHGFAESGTKSIARTYAVVYACTRTRTRLPHPEDIAAERQRSKGTGRSFQFFLLPSRPAGSRDSRGRIRVIHGRSLASARYTTPCVRGYVPASIVFCNRLKEFLIQWGKS